MSYRSHRITTQSPADMPPQPSLGSEAFKRNRETIAAAFGRSRRVPPKQTSLTDAIAGAYRAFNGIPEPKRVESREVPNHVFKAPALLEQAAERYSREKIDEARQAVAVGAYENGTGEVSLDRYSPPQLEAGLDRLLDDIVAADLRDETPGHVPTTYMSEQQANDLAADCETDH